MLARSQSDAGARLRRAKSTSSAYSHTSAHPVERADPVVVRKHAVAAAATAFDRAYGSEEALKRIDRRPEIPQRKRNTGRASEGSHFPSRQTSFRSSFDAAPRGGRASQRPELPHKPLSFVSSPAASSIVSEPPTLRPVLPAHHRPHGFGTSGPSLNQKLRKSRSMYNADDRNGLIPSTPGLTETSNAYQAKNNLAVKSPVPGASQHKRLAKDDSWPLKQPELPALRKENVAVNAREEVSQDANQPALRTRASFMLGPFKKRQDRSSRSSAQIGHVTYDGFAAVPDHPSTDAPVIPMTDGKPRSVSNSLKSRLRRVFRKSSNGTPNLPVQQINASRSHFGNYPLDSPAVHSHFEEIPLPDEEILTRARSLTPSVHSPPSSPHIAARRSVSGRSEGEASNAKSRVTSWSNSSAGNTVTSLGSKRLSVINEDDRNQGSPATPKQQSVPLLRRLSKKMSKRKLSGSKEYADLYSALVQRIDETGLMAKNSPAVNSTASSERPKTIHDTLPSQTRTSSLTSRFSRRTRATIRTVSPEEGEERIGVAHGTPVTPKPAHQMPVVPGSDESVEVEHEGAVEGPRCRSSVLNVRRTRPLQTLLVTSPTAEQIANRIAKSEDRWKAPLEDSAPIFFPCSAGNYSTGRSSAIVSRSATPQGPPGNQESDLGGSLTVSKPTTSKLRDAASPSIYSRTTEVQSPRPNDSVLSLAHTDNGETGTVTIIASTSAAAYPVTSPTPNRRTQSQSTKSSGNWRSWLSREVKDLTVLPQEDISIKSQFDTKDSGHRREHAQIVNGEDTDIAPVKASKGRPRKSSRPKLEDRPSSRMNERFPYIEPGRKISPRQAQLTQKTSPPAERAPPKPAAKENMSSKQPGRGPRLSRPLSMQLISANLRSNSSLAQYTTTSAGDAPKRDTTASPSPSRPRYSSTAHAAYKPKSAVDLRGEYSPGLSPRHAGNARRKAALFDDNTLRHISAGPYGSSVATPSPARNKENSPGLGVAARDFAEGSSRRGTPTSGQRMAEDWLRERRLARGGRMVSESPVFL